MKKVLYARFSTGKPSAEWQLEAIRASLGPEDEVSGEFIDECTGKVTGPRLEEALELVRQGKANALYVTSLDRLSREPGQLERLQSLLAENGAQLQVVEDIHDHS